MDRLASQHAVQVLTGSARICHMDAGRERASNVSIGAAVLVWAASFVISWIALGLTALQEGLMPLYEEHTVGRHWVTPTMFSLSVLAASAVAWLVFRLLQDKIHFHQYSPAFVRS
jgi:hypothetical protein